MLSDRGPASLPVVLPACAQHILLWQSSPRREMVWRPLYESSNSVTLCLFHDCFGMAAAVPTRITPPNFEIIVLQ